MKQRITMPSLVLLTLVLVGCTPAWVGTWSATDFAAPEGAEGATRALLTVEEDGDYTAMYERASGTPMQGSIGRWEEVSKKRIRFIQMKGAWPRVTAAEMNADKDLMLITEQSTTVFTKEKK